ncbi:hypothetical protein OH805_00110 [Streptomyces sp. NBC_00879]|uniref:hypothetical protein n=1 Tax=Streptomyces sp. NBC_00879 TaxID=2975855 RepID=UPI00386E104B|nr:hypothetical protein OH805_00110 [Streptomyces sp. NBC_00879]
MADLTFANSENPITPDRVIVHDNESFRVQWSALNISGQDVPAFTDRLLIESIPEGCPGSDATEHEAVFDSDQDGDISDFSEPDLTVGQSGPLMSPSVGPFAAGSYRLTVTLANDLGVGETTFNCIEIVSAP